MVRRSASTKERPKVHRESRPSKEQKPHSDSGYSTSAIVTGSDASSLPAQRIEATEKTAKEERRKSSGSNMGPRKSTSRPPSTHHNATFPAPPNIDRPRDNPSHYGVSARPPSDLAQPIPLRPHAITSNSYTNRPQSVHAGYTGGYRPPLSNSAYFQQLRPMPPSSYPPPSAYAPNSQNDYFTRHPPLSQPLKDRFNISRTTSAIGTREAPRELVEAFRDDYESASGQVLEGRRASIREPSRGLSKAEEDYNRMPPPPLQSILRRPDMLGVSPSDLADAPTTTYSGSRSIYRDDAPSMRRPSANRNSVSYDLGKDTDKYRVETANNGRRRRSYYYGQSSGSSGYEEKVHQAVSYQDGVTGGPPVALTAELLRKQQRRQAGSSRSTKSSGSRDDSDYRRSATTRTTRSGSGLDDENVTIKVKGDARVMVGGAQIECKDGGEIQIKRQTTVRDGSERSNSEYSTPAIDDRRSSRVDRATSRTRMSSQPAHSYKRLTTHYN
jgi:hypothetical protein